MKTILPLALIAILVDCRCCGRASANPTARSSAVPRNATSKAFLIRSSLDGLGTWSAARFSIAVVACSSGGNADATTDTRWPLSSNRFRSSRRELSGVRVSRLEMSSEHFPNSSGASIASVADSCPSGSLGVAKILANAVCPSLPDTAGAAYPWYSCCLGSQSCQPGWYLLLMSSWVTASSPFSDCRSRCVSPCDHLIKELSYIVKQEIGLFQSREVSALRHLRPSTCACPRAVDGNKSKDSGTALPFPSMRRPTLGPPFHPTTRRCPSGTYRSVPDCLGTLEPVRGESRGTVPTHCLRSPPHLRPMPYRAACRT